MNYEPDMPVQVVSSCKYERQRGWTGKIVDRSDWPNFDWRVRADVDNSIYHYRDCDIQPMMEGPW